MATSEHTTYAPTTHQSPLGTPQGVRCVVVTPERALLDVAADFVALPMYDGELGVLPGRLPLIGRLGYGELRFTRGNQVRKLFVDGGFAQVRNDVVTVLTARAIEAERIDVHAVQQALNHALSNPSVRPEDTQANYRAQERARAQLRVAGASAGVGEHH